jgi:predicted site-specific integrase-resolvase
MAKTISIIELAKRAGVTIQTAYHWCWLGTVKAKKVDGVWVIPESEAAKMIERRNP